MPDNDKFDPRDQFGFRLGRLARFWRARLDEKMRPHGLTQARWVVMVHLRRGEHDPLAAHGAHRSLEDDGQQDPAHR